MSFVFQHKYKLSISFFYRRCDSGDGSGGTKRLEIEREFLGRARLDRACVRVDELGNGAIIRRRCATWRAGAHLHGPTLTRVRAAAVLRHMDEDDRLWCLGEWCPDNVSHFRTGPRVLGKAARANAALVAHLLKFDTSFKCRRASVCVLLKDTSAG